MGAALPLWLLIPPAVVMLLVLAGYVQALYDADVDPTRRRIRSAGAVVMMALQPLLVYLFGIASAQQPRPFVFAWALVTSLLGLLVILALLDMLHSARLSARRRTLMREELRVLQREIAGLRNAPGVPPLRLVSPEERREGEGSSGA
jgi:hypothetical protein